LVVFLGCLISFLNLLAPASAADARQEKKLDRARLVFEQFQREPLRAAPAELIESTKCLAIFPNLVRAALVFGGRHGTGVVSCRNLEGKWSPPAFAKLSEGSLGVQIGYQSSDVILFFVTDRSAKSLLTAQMSLGADASIAAGPLERNAGVTSDPEWAADVFIYSRSKGFFAGAAFQGSRIAMSQEAIRRYYERQVWAEEVLLAHRVPILPPKAKALMTTLQQATD
jgi:lipid-binding SYLF domain-containing protein